MYSPTLNPLPAREGLTKGTIVNVTCITGNPVINFGTNRTICEKQSCSFVVQSNVQVTTWCEYGEFTSNSTNPLFYSIFNVTRPTISQSSTTHNGPLTVSLTCQPKDKCVLLYTFDKTASLIPNSKNIIKSDSSSVTLVISHFGFNILRVVTLDEERQELSPELSERCK